MKFLGAMAPWCLGFVESSCRGSPLPSDSPFIPQDGSRNLAVLSDQDGDRGHCAVVLPVQPSWLVSEEALKDPCQVAPQGSIILHALTSGQSQWYLWWRLCSGMGCEAPWGGISLWCHLPLSNKSLAAWVSSEVEECSTPGYTHGSQWLQAGLGLHCSRRPRAEMGAENFPELSLFFQWTFPYLKFSCPIHFLTLNWCHSQCNVRYIERNVLLVI